MMTPHENSLPRLFLPLTTPKSHKNTKEAKLFIKTLLAFPAGLTPPLLDTRPPPNNEYEDASATQSSKSNAPAANFGAMMTPHETSLPRLFLPLTTPKSHPTKPGKLNKRSVTRTPRKPKFSSRPSLPSLLAQHCLYRTHVNHQTMNTKTEMPKMKITSLKTTLAP
jgi:hypothetical protein